MEACHFLIVMYLLKGPLSKFSTFVYRGVYIGPRALLDILHVHLIGFCFIARLSQWGGGGFFTRSNDFYLPSLRS